MRDRKVPCFTLIELLIVIAIIAILAAILLPALNKAKARGTRITCLNNQRQMHLTCMNYTSDMDDYYPIHWFKEPGYLPSPYYHCTYVWHLIKAGYLSPEDNTSYPNDQRICPMLATKKPRGANGYNTSHYTLSWYLSGYHNSTTWVYQPYRVNQIKKPTITYELAEAQYWVPESTNSGYAGKLSCGGFDFAMWDPKYNLYLGGDLKLDGSNIWTDATLIRPRHVEGFNMIFSDGHGTFLSYPYQDSTKNTTLEGKMTL